MPKRILKRPPEAWNIKEHRRLLDRFDESKECIINGCLNSGDQLWVEVTEIVVPTERDKQQVLQALKYLHDNRTIDTDFLAVNALVHMYELPDRIKIVPITKEPERDKL